MARRMETRRCAVCGKEFQAAAEGHRTKCDEHKGRARRIDTSHEVATALQYRPASSGQKCTVVTGATGRRCGKPAVVEFTGSRGETFGECETHAPRRRHS